MAEELYTINKPSGIKSLLAKVLGLKPQPIPVQAVKGTVHLGDAEKKILTGLGVFVNNLSRLISQTLMVNQDRLSITRECLVGETKIELLNGEEIEIEKIANNILDYSGKYVYSINPNTLEFEPDKIIDCWLTKKYSKVVRVWLDNNQYIDCTSNHLFMMRDGKYKEAKDLQSGESLMPLYIKPMGKSMELYNKIYNPGKNRWNSLHFIVTHFIYGKKPNCKQPFIITTANYSRKTCSTKCEIELGKQIYYENKRLILNHKVLKIEELQELRDVYDLQTERNHNFALSVGVYVHNCERCINHPMMSAAVKLYTATATNFDRVNNATVWITSENSKYRNTLEQLLNDINIEERIYDWTFNIAQFGNHFIEPIAVPGVGIISVNDDENQINLSRIDKDGVLIGFYRTPLGTVTQTQQLLPPWQYVQFRMFGTKVRRPVFGEFQSNEFRTISLLSPDIRRLSAKYGSGVLNDAIPVYKRMRLVEDSIMLARLSKGILRNIIKIGVSGSNIEAVQEILKQYETILKRNVALDTSKPNYTDNLDYTDVVTDIILPVWDNVNNLEVEKIGGEVDIKWLADLDDLREQLATALDVPLHMLGGYTPETPSALSAAAAETTDIRFARKARGLQRSVIEGIRRICQLHLAFQGMDPNLNLFDVNMSSTSTAEESEAVKALKETTETVQEFTEYITGLLGDRIDRLYLINFLNDKFFKLNDFEVNKLLQNPQEHVIVTKESVNKETLKKFLTEKKIEENKLKEIFEYIDKNFNGPRKIKPIIMNSDVKAMIPFGHQFKGMKINGKILSENKGPWFDLYGKAKVKEEFIKEKK